jgi:putative oxidoreductase
LGPENAWTPRLLSVLRIVTAFLFVMHGSAKVLHFPHQPEFDDIALFSLIGIGGLLELVGGLLVLIGLFTRPVAFILSGEMAVAYFMFHAPTAFLPLLNEGDAAVLFCFVFLYLAFAGPGPWSADAMWRARRDAASPGRGAA